jgi:threonylcarbamoyladenosine tRNA methylthiotransferase MtaB
LQSGDDEILKKMNRNYSSADFVKKVLKIKRAIPDIAITTDVLVGFPAESEKNFQNTLKVIKMIMPLKVHAFPYSAREGALAAIQYKQAIDAAVIKKRMERLKDLAESCSRAFKKKFLNKKMDALIERRWRQDPRFWKGYTQNYMEVLVKSRLNLKNKIIRIERKHFLGYNNT